MDPKRYGKLKDIIRRAEAEEQPDDYTFPVFLIDDPAAERFMLSVGDVRLALWYVEHVENGQAVN